ncbi:MAG: CHASE2 domain-containing protein [Bdellovibrionaceae bacterium]|nr:CHASE2 domain-containing protein [Pseudobdellovibrionaceae bacterium]
MALPPSLKTKESLSRWDRIKFLGIIVFRVALATGLALFIHQIKLDFFEAYLYDLRIRYSPSPEPSGHVQIVEINPESVEYFKGIPRFADHTRVLEEIKKLSPKAIVYDLNYDEISGTPPEKLKFAKAADTVDQLFVLTNFLEMRGEEGKLRLSEPFEKLKLFSGPKSTDTANFAKDGVTRRMMVNYQDQLMLHPYLAASFNSEITDKYKIRGLFDFLETDQLYIRFRPTNAYDKIPFHYLAQGKVSKQAIQNKIVIIGQNLELTEKDYILTPYSRSSIAMTTTEMHANMLDTLILNNAVVRAPQWVNLAITILISIITVYIVFAVRPAFGLLIIISLFLTYVAFAYFAFWPLGFWISMAHPLLAIFLCYYFFIPYRLIIENRRSWEYYEKNKLLKQVEELKTNFISMMSHDLKTPIARIKGMTDVILSDSQAVVSVSQREAVDTIRSSSDDLLKFINSILNYAKIEFQGVELHWQSKDPNNLMSDVIKKHEFLAQLKKMKIHSELEPLFPVKMDPDLMRQVLSNILENAIKYAPEQTQISVRTFEKDGFVFFEIADQGLGIPAQELPHLFTKFYRSANAKSSPIKGSGLGLYLAKYFTELHQGAIFVESETGKGTIFTVQLPQL